MCVNTHTHTETLIASPDLSYCLYSWVYFEGSSTPKYLHIYHATLNLSENLTKAISKDLKVQSKDNFQIQVYYPLYLGCYCKRQSYCCHEQSNQGFTLDRRYRNYRQQNRRHCQRHSSGRLCQGIINRCFWQGGCYQVSWSNNLRQPKIYLTWLKHVLVRKTKLVLCRHGSVLHTAHTPPRPNLPSLVLISAVPK